MIKLLFFLFGFSLTCAAQISQQDSIKQVLSVSKDATERTLLAHKLIDYYHRNQPDSTRKYLDIAREASQLAKNIKLQARTEILEAILLMDLGEYDQSVALSQKAIGLSEQIKDYSGLGSAHNLIGNLYKVMGDTQKVRTQTKKGLEYVSKAVECFGKANDTLGFIRAYNNMGIIYRDLDETKKAMEAYQTGLGLAKRAGIENTGVGILNANLGQLYIDEGRNIPKGIGLLKDAIVLHEKFNNQKSMEHANRNLAYAYRHLKKYDEAILYAQKAVVISEILQDPHRAADSYLILYLAQKDVGKDNEALVNLEKSKEFADVAMRLEKTKSIAEMEAKYETVKKDASIDVLNKNAELDRTKKLALLVSLALLTIIAAFVVIGISQKRKRDNEIFAQENAVEEEKRKSVE